MKSKIICMVSSDLQWKQGIDAYNSQSKLGISSGFEASKTLYL